MGVNLIEAWDKIVEKLDEAFPAFNVVAGEDAGRDEIETPAIVVDMTELEPNPANDPTTGEWSCLAHFEARVLVGYRETRARHKVASIAGQVASFVHNERLGVEWDSAEVIATHPDEFSPKADQFRVWLVEWVHGCNVGEPIDQGDGEAASTVLSSFAPEIGEDHAGEYEDVTGV